MRIGVGPGTLAAVMSVLILTPAMAKDMQEVTLYETKASFDEARQDLRTRL